MLYNYNGFVIQHGTRLIYIIQTFFTISIIFGKFNLCIYTKKFVCIYKKISSIYLFIEIYRANY